MIKNSYLQIMSVIIALFLWVMVVLGQVETESISVPVNLLNVPKGYVALSSVPNVSVTVKGAAKLITNMPYSSVLLNIDISSFPVGVSPRRILPQDFKAPLGVEVIDVTPKEFDVSIDQIAVKTVRVIPTFIGDTIPGFKVESVSTKPETVEIEGAKSKLKDLSSVATLPVNISNIDDSFVSSIGFRPENGVKNIKPNTVEVRIKMREDIEVRNIKNVSVNCMDLREGLTLKNIPKLSTVKIKGRVDLLDQFTLSSLFLVNCSEITKSGKYSAPIVYSSAIDGVEVISITPQKINFEIH